MYIATFRDTCKTAELPAHCGHLVFTNEIRWGNVVCKRHPRYNHVEYSPEQMWQLFFRYVMDHERQVWAERSRVSEVLEKIGHRAAAEVFASLREIRKQVESGTH